jgi:basic membrane protein A and related proteins
MTKNLMALLSAVLVSAVCAQTPAAKPIEVGFVYVTPIADAGWTAQHEAGRQAMMKALGSKVKSTYVEKVAEGADAERVIREMAASGKRVIFTTSFGYMEPTLKIAKEFPNVRFEHATGYKYASNMGTYNARFYEGRYLAGMVAAGTSKSAVAGYVAAFPIPEVIQGINAFTLGMRAINPQAQVKVIWTNSWYDPAKEKEATAALIAQGADVLTHHTDSTATVQEAEARGKYAIGYHSDMSKYGPKAHLTSVQHHWGDFYTQVVQDVIADKTKPKYFVWGGMKDKMVSLGKLSSAVPKATVDAVRAKEAAIIAGKFHPFSGEIKDNEGKVRLSAGSMGDQVLNQMDYYVEGVVGKLKP